MFSSDRRVSIALRISMCLARTWFLRSDSLLGSFPFNSRWICEWRRSTRFNPSFKRWRHRRSNIFETYRQKKKVNRYHRVTFIYSTSSEMVRDFWKIPRTSEVIWHKYEMASIMVCSHYKFIDVGHKRFTYCYLFLQSKHISKSLNTLPELQTFR